MKIFYTLESSYVSWNHEIKLTGLNFPIIEINMTRENPNSVIFCFIVEDGLDIENLKIITKEKLIELIDLLLYKYNVVFYDFYLSKIELNESDAIGQTRFDMQIKIYQEISEVNKKELQNLIRDKHLIHSIQSKTNFQLFKEAMRVREEIGQFVILYSILIDLKGPQQFKVDNFIKSAEKNVELRTSTKNENQKETIYTWIRNQLGHTQKTSDLKEVRILVSNNIGKFIRIVKKAIFS
ncbi:hypothetical protein [Neobacillus mesonae]|uniref:hypothetical protein n=1 Tax=Neobacillus mesonae TaxID=1193713 RepID=UPI00203C3240|nr:hypothetical protein [Neobacillus mesonae]MCM3567866.1 hypothetical protein [Neobacillus mesonae]